MNHPITIPKIDPPTFDVYFEGEFVGRFNEYEIGDLRVQIKEGGVEGYSIMDDGSQYYIHTSGKFVDRFPPNLGAIWEEQIDALFGGY